MSDFEFARDRIMMGIERRKLQMLEKDRLNTAIHEAGHAVTCYFTPSAKKLYKATIVARGGSLGAVTNFLFIIPYLNFYFRLIWFPMIVICYLYQRIRY